MSKDKELVYVDPTTLTIIGLDTEHREGEHALYDVRSQLPLNEELVKNILVLGVQQPVHVRAEGGQLLVVDGRQRTKAAREAARRQSEHGTPALKVPIVEIEGDDKRLMGLMVSLNEQRTDSDMLEKCQTAVRLKDQGMTVEELAIFYGRSKTTIKNWFSLANASPKVHAALKAGKVSTSAAVELSKLSTREEQETELEKLTGTGERVSEAKAKKARREAAGSAAGAENQAAAAPAAEVPEPTAPVGSDGKARKGKGKSTKSRKETITTSSGQKKTSARQAKQSGIKRTWLRKSLKTEAAKSLSDEQRGVIEWFAHGKSPKGTWYDEFMVSAELEMGESASDGAAE